MLNNRTNPVVIVITTQDVVTAMHGQIHAGHRQVKILTMVVAVIAAVVVAAAVAKANLSPRRGIVPGQHHPL